MTWRPAAAGMAVSLLSLALVAAGGCGSRREDKAVQSTQNDADARRRATMVETQIAARGVRDPRVLAGDAARVPRHRFVRRASARGPTTTPAPDRPRPDDLAALHRRDDDASCSARSGREGARGRHRVGLPGRGARARCAARRLVDRDPAELAEEARRLDGSRVRNVTVARRRRLPRRARGRSLRRDRRHGGARPRAPAPARAARGRRTHGRPGRAIHAGAAPHRAEPGGRHSGAAHLPGPLRPDDRRDREGEDAGTVRVPPSFRAQRDRRPPTRPPEASPRQ